MLIPNPIVHAAVRDGDDEWHIECRFKDGQKYAAIRVDKECEGLAEWVAYQLNRCCPGRIVAETDEIPD
jgi:hypothetical protein